jgi:hypothetical protein
VLNAASTDSDSPAEEIPSSYLRIINSDTTGMADRELQTQMSELGHADAGFVHGLAASIYMGEIIWNNRSSPSNLSLFTVFKLDPLSSMQRARCLLLHFLSKNTEGKSMDEIKASQIQEAKIPTTFEELCQSLLFYSGITSILFGTGSSLVAGVNSLANTIKTEKIIFKGRFAADSDFPTKILYTMEIRIQRWLAEGQKFSDRSMVNDRLVSLDKIFEMVMNSSLKVILPPNFIKPPPKIQSPEPNPMPGQDKKGEWKKRKSDEANDHIVKNAAPITEFLIKESKDWRQDFAGKCSTNRPKWDDTSFMCVRRHIRGKCFVDCNNKVSHAGACAVPQAKRTEFKKYLDKVRRENSPSPSA